jgi:AcrR family transcriptional regulator
LVSMRLSSPTTRRRSAKAALIEEFRVRAIREAVLDVVGREGLEAATLQRIADRAGVAKGTIYLYFKDRDDLLQHTARFVMGEVRARVEPWMASQAAFAERLRGLVAAGLTIIEEHRGFLRFYLPLPQDRLGGGGARNTAARSSVLERQDTLRGALKEFLARAARRGEIRRTDANRLAQFIVDAVTGVIVTRLSEARPPAIAAEVDWIVDMLLHGMSPRGRSRS